MRHGPVITRMVLRHSLANAYAPATEGKPMSERTIAVHLTDAELALLIEALDSHEYWQLSEPHERNDGHSTIEDGENKDIDAVRMLVSKLDDDATVSRRRKSVGAASADSTIL